MKMITLLKKLIFLISKNGIFLKFNLSPFIGLVGLKILFVLNTELELLNEHILFQKLMKNAAFFLKEVLMISLLKNSVIYILVLFNLLLSHLLEKVLMLLFSCDLSLLSS